MKNKPILFAALIVSAAVLSAGQVSAYRGDPEIVGPNYDPDRHEAIEQAFETGNYEAWKELMSGKGRVTQIITADNFSEFANAHELAKSGDLEGATAIRTSLGRGVGNRPAQGQGFGQGIGRQGR
jgi:hypothetical protein